MTPQEKMQLQETLDDFAYQLAELGRKIHLASGIPGAVASYDPKTHTATVDIGYETHAMPVGDNEGDFSPLRVGQLVHVYAPSGDLANAFVKPAGYSGSATPPANAAGQKVMSLPGGGALARWTATWLISRRSRSRASNSSSAEPFTRSNPTPSRPHSPSKDGCF